MKDINSTFLLYILFSSFSSCLIDKKLEDKDFSLYINVYEDEKLGKILNIYPPNETLIRTENFDYYNSNDTMYIDIEKITYDPIGCLMLRDFDPNLIEHLALRLDSNINYINIQKTKVIHADSIETSYIKKYDNRKIN